MNSLLSFSSFTTSNKKKPFNIFSHETFRYISPKEKILSLNYSSNTFSTQNRKYFNTNKLFIDNYNININNNNRFKMRSHLKNENNNSFSLNSLLNDKKIKLTESYPKSLMFLDISDNKKTNNKKSGICNTESNINSFIKVNIKSNYLKEKGKENKKHLKKKNNEHNLKGIKKKLNENKRYEINKILVIQKWWKNYYNQLIYIRKKLDIIKMQYFFDIIKRTIYKFIMKSINKEKKYMKNAINKKKNKVQIERPNLMGKNINKNIYKNKELNYYSNNSKNYKTNTYKHVTNKRIIDEKIMMDFTTKNNDINNYSYKGHKRDNIISFSSNLTPMLFSLQNSFEEDNNNNLYSLNDSQKKITFNKNIDNINNAIKSSFNKNTNINSNKYARVEKIKKLNKTISKNIKEKYSMHNNTYSNKSKKKKVIKNDSIAHNKLSLNYYYNKNTNDKTLYKKYNIFLEDDENYSQLNLSKNKNVNTEPNNYNNNIINNINSKEGNYIKKNCLTLNVSHKTHKINKSKYYKLRKFDTCPMYCNNNKLNLYKKFYIKKYSSYWDRIIIKNKILNNFIEFSNQIKLKFLFCNRYIQIIFQTFKLLFMNIYFTKYKDIINRNIILNSLKKYLLNRRKINTLLNGNNNNFSCFILQRGDIINNININNYINYTKDELNTLIPKKKEDYNLMSSSVKLNSNTHSYFKSALPYLNVNNINYTDDTNKIKNNVNIKNKYPQVFPIKKREILPKGILVDQINQLRMIFNLLEQHSDDNSDNTYHILKYFKKWKKLCENSLNNKASNRINVNYKKINIQNKKNKQNFGKNVDKNIINSNNIIKKAEVEKVKYLRKPINEINCNKYVKIKCSKNDYKAGYANTVRGSENSDILKNDSNKIRFIENANKIIPDNISDSSNNKNKFNSEIVYQKKILNYNNQTSNINNDIYYLHKSKISEYRLNNYNNNNKIEEREVHFKSLSSNKHNTYKKMKNNNINIVYNDNFNIFDNNINRNKDKINKNEDIQLKKKISNIKIISESIKLDDNYINVKDSINENNCNNLINKIKKLFSKERKVVNHKINQTFCCSPINLLDELD